MFRSALINVSTPIGTPMKKIMIALLLLLLGVIAPACLSPTPKTAHAMFAKYTDADLVQASALIVTGKLLGHTQLTLNQGQIKLNLGVVQVNDVLKGNPEKTLILLELPAADAPRSSSDLTYQTGQTGLWFLQPRTPTDDGIYRANHPQRFLSAATTDRIQSFRKLARP
jgi:hypothetical protein